MRIQKFGFESVDQNPHLLETFPVVSVMKGDLDLMKIEAKEFPSRLGRALRKKIFGQNGLVETIIGAEHSSRKEAEGSDVKLFFG